jgi:hypothetical protein
MPYSARPGDDTAALTCAGGGQIFGEEADLLLAL